MRSEPRVLRCVERFFNAVAMFFILAIMVVVFVDVLCRYFLNSPLGWTYDMISLYLMPGLFFLMLSDSYAFHSHVSVDLLTQKLSPKGRRYSEIITSVVGIAIFSLIAYAIAGRAYGNFINHDTMSGLIAWPTWIGAAFAPLGLTVLIIRMLYRLIGNVMSLVTGNNVVNVLPKHVHSAGE